MKRALWIGLLLGLVVTAVFRTAQWDAVHVGRTYRWGLLPVEAMPTTPAPASHPEPSPGSYIVRVYDVTPLVMKATEAANARMRTLEQENGGIARVLPMRGTTDSLLIQINGTNYSISRPDHLLERPLHTAVLGEFRGLSTSGWMWSWSGRLVLLLTPEQHARVERMLNVMAQYPAERWPLLPADQRDLSPRSTMP